LGITEDIVLDSSLAIVEIHLIRYERPQESTFSKNYFVFSLYEIAKNLIYSVINME